MVGTTYTAYSKKHPNDNTFDAIVIGSGTGGLSTASFLAQAGKRVLVLEQHYIVGGYTHAFQRKGYVWDVGLHYVGQVHIPGTLLNKVFRYISKDKLKWEPLDDVYDRIVFGEKEYEFPRGRENLRAALKEYFPAPEDHASIDTYFQLLHDVENVGVGYWIEKVLPPAIANLVGDKMRAKLLRFSDHTTLEVLQTITQNEQLLGVLTAQYGDYGLEPAKSSFYMHALLANHYMEGAGYPVGGAEQFAETVVPVVEEAGGAVLTRARVKNIIVENNTAVGVEMEDGGTFRAKHIVSATGVANTFGSLIPRDIAEKHGLIEKLRELEPSAAHVGLYVGINEATENLNLPKCNYWIFPEEYNHERGRENYKTPDSPIPVAFASFPSAKNPTSGEQHPGKTTAEVIIIVPYEWFKKWEGTEWHKRGEEYEQLKEQFGQQMLEQLFRVAPQLRGKVEYYEVSTPLSTQHYSAHPKGEIYGVTHTPKRFRQKWLRVHTPVKNLFLGGQDVMTASIAGGTMGGLLAACAVLKKNLLWTVKRKIQ